LGFEQITIILPLRRMILHLSQIFFMDERTFIFDLVVAQAASLSLDFSTTVFSLPLNEPPALLANLKRHHCRRVLGVAYLLDKLPGLCRPAVCATYSGT
jgi:hypothetical protein